MQVEVLESGLRITDLDSTNGTYYLKTQVHELVVLPGAVLALGDSRIALGRLDDEDATQSEPRDDYGVLVGRSRVMRELYGVLERIEKVDDTVLVQGETGVGKDLIALEIHRHSARRDAPYEIFDCGAVAGSLIESALFGHVRGAFTGAESTHKGLFESAEGGTVFLDEIGDLPLQLQPKLLRVLENRTIRPLGSSQSLSVNVRLVAATNRDLQADVDAGRFRSDLFYRLNVVDLLVPALRERREDIPLLIDYFLGAAGRGEAELSPTTVELFTSGYDWPGNVRELGNAISRVVAVGTLPAPLVESDSKAQRSEEAGAAFGLDADEPFLAAKKRLVDAFERDYLITQMRRANDNIAEAARLSGMDRAYLRRVLMRHGLLPQGKS